MINKKLSIGAALIVALVVLGVGQTKIQESSVAASNGVMAPHFEVDPFWPRPLPNMWAMGNTIGVDVDERGRQRSHDALAVRTRHGENKGRHSGSRIDNAVSEANGCAPVGG